METKYKLIGRTLWRMEFQGGAMTAKMIQSRIPTAEDLVNTLQYHDEYPNEITQ